MVVDEQQQVVDEQQPISTATARERGLGGVSGRVCPA
jgi:hypothetical protein